MSDFEALYRAVESRDARWDGRVYVGVTSTGIYCRPICPVPMPRRDHVRFFPTAPAAERAGFRACRRCRPEQSPGSPDWDVRGDLVGRALRLVAGGVADDAGIGGLARQLAVSSRHLRRLFVEALGATPRDVVGSQRAGLAKQLLEQTDLSSTDIAFAVGFGSVRAYNGALRRSFGRTPTEIRAHRQRDEVRAGVRLRLSYRPPLATAALLGFLRARAIPGVEHVSASCYARTIQTTRGSAILSLEPRLDGPIVELSLDAVGPGELAPLVRAARRLFDLDADPVAIDAALAADPILRPLVEAAPGTRLPGVVDGWAATVLAVLAQGVALATARTLAGRIATTLGPPTGSAHPDLGHLFPDPDVIADADLSPVGLPLRRLITLRALAREVASGRITLDEGADPEATLSALRAVPGIGPWTAGYVGLRVLRDPDALPPGDAAIRSAFRRLGLPADDRAIAARAEAWRPWRGYAVAHLWGLAR